MRALRAIALAGVALAALWILASLRGTRSPAWSPAWPLALVPLVAVPGGVVALGALTTRSALRALRVLLPLRALEVLRNRATTPVVAPGSWHVPLPVSPLAAFRLVGPLGTGAGGRRSGHVGVPPA